MRRSPVRRIRCRKLWHSQCGAVGRWRGLPDRVARVFGVARDGGHQRPPASPRHPTGPQSPDTEPQFAESDVDYAVPAPAPDRQCPSGGLGAADRSSPPPRHTPMSLQAAHSRRSFTDPTAASLAAALPGSAPADPPLGQLDIQVKLTGKLLYIGHSPCRTLPVGVDCLPGVRLRQQGRAPRWDKAPFWQRTMAVGPAINARRCRPPTVPSER